MFSYQKDCQVPKANKVQHMYLELKFQKIKMTYCIYKHLVKLLLAFQKVFSLGRVQEVRARSRKQNSIQ